MLTVRTLVAPNLTKGFGGREMDREGRAYEMFLPSKTQSKCEKDKELQHFNEVIIVKVSVLSLPQLSLGTLN